MAEHRRRPGTRPVEQRGHRLLAVGRMAVAGQDNDVDPRHAAQRGTGRHGLNASRVLAGAGLVDGDRAGEQQGVAAVSGAELAEQAANSLKYHDRRVSSTIPTVRDRPPARTVARLEAEKSSRPAVAMMRCWVFAPTPRMPRSARDTVPLFTPASRATLAMVARRGGACRRVAITQWCASAGT